MVSPMQPFWTPIGERHRSFQTKNDILLRHIQALSIQFPAGKELPLDFSKTVRNRPAEVRHI